MQQEHEESTVEQKLPSVEQKNGAFSFLCKKKAKNEATNNTYQEAEDEIYQIH